MSAPTTIPTLNLFSGMATGHVAVISLIIGQSGVDVHAGSSFTEVAIAKKLDNLRNAP
jgi:hypothetical protein